MKLTPAWLICILFVGLKLTGFIDWSWWWVTAPIWGGFVALCIFFGAIEILKAWKNA